jgi:hypothetical protein
VRADRGHQQQPEHASHQRSLAQQAEPTTKPEPARHGEEGERERRQPVPKHVRQMAGEGILDPDAKDDCVVEVLPADRADREKQCEKENAPG